MKPRNNDNNEEQIPMQSRNKQTETNEQYEISPLLLKDSENSSKTSREIQDNDADQVNEIGRDSKTDQDKTSKYASNQDKETKKGQPNGHRDGCSYTL